jgi:exonuclease VII small subunit
LDTQSIIAELESERDNLDRAIAALRGNRIALRKSSSKGDGRKRHLSAAARKRIGEAMKKRWAERKKKSAA